MSTTVPVQVSIKPKTVFRRIPDAVVTQLNGCFPNLGSQLSDLLAVATEFQKESTAANEAKFQSYVSGLVQDLLVTGIGRSPVSNGLITSVPCIDTERSSKPESGSQKRKFPIPTEKTIDASEGVLSPPIKQSKRTKTLVNSSSPSGVTQKVTIPQAAFVQPKKPALELLKQLYPDMIPEIRKKSAEMFTVAMNDLHAYKQFKQYTINSKGWDLFLACIDRETPEVVHKTFFQDVRIQCDKEKFATWFHKVKLSVQNIPKFALKSAILARALEKMKDYYSDTEDGGSSVESEIETGEKESLDDEVKENNTDCIFFTNVL
jgi:hypothetical protein